MPPQPFPYVTNVTINKDQVVLTVKVSGFTTGQPVELSGHATQNGGALAVFNEIQPVPAPNPDNTVIMYVTSLSAQGFEKGDPVTVVLRVATVWATVLGEEQQNGDLPELSQPDPAEDGRSWSVIKSVAYPALPSGTTADQASSGDEANFPA